MNVVLLVLLQIVLWVGAIALFVWLLRTAWRGGSLGVKGSLLVVVVQAIRRVWEHALAPAIRRLTGRRRRRY